MQIYRKILPIPWHPQLAQPEPRISSTTHAATFHETASSADAQHHPEALLHTPLSHVVDKHQHAVRAQQRGARIKRHAHLRAGAARHLQLRLRKAQQACRQSEASRNAAQSALL